MKLPAITCDAILCSVRTRADNSLGLTFSTPELQPQEMLAFLQVKNSNLKMLLQPVGEPPEELVMVKTDLHQKTPSERLRGVLFIQFKQQDQVKDFSVFYMERMAQILEEQKAKLEPSTF